MKLLCSEECEAYDICKGILGFCEDDCEDEINDLFTKCPECGRSLLDDGSCPNCSYFEDT